MVLIVTQLWWCYCLTGYIDIHGLIFDLSIKYQEYLVDKKEKFHVTRQRSTVRNSDEKKWAMNMNLWKIITPVKHSPLCPLSTMSVSTMSDVCVHLVHVDHLKIFTPEKCSPLKTSRPWKIFTPEKYSRLKNIHHVHVHHVHVYHVHVHHVFVFFIKRRQPISYSNSWTPWFW